MSWESNPYTLAYTASIVPYTDKPPVGLEPTIYRLEVCRLIHWATGAKVCHEVGKVSPRFELGFQDSKSWVLTATL